MVRREILAVFECKQKRAITLKSEVTPTKIVFHAFQVDLHLYEFFEPILFFDPHGL